MDPSQKSSAFYKYQSLSVKKKQVINNASSYWTSVSLGGDVQIETGELEKERGNKHCLDA